MNQKRISLILSLILSALLIAISVNLYICASFGGDSITVFEQGLHNTFNVSLGVASYIYAFLTLILGFILGKKYISWISITNSLLCGPFINLIGLVFNNITINSFVVRIIMFAFAILATALSCVILIVKESGTSTLDAAVLGIVDRTKCKYKVIRTTTDIMLLILGILMGGKFGIGSIIATLITGTMISIFVRILKGS